MKLVTYLSFDSNAEEVINYYQSIIGGEITNMQKYKEIPDFANITELQPFGEYLIHARLELAEFEIYFSDSYEELNKGNNVSLSLQCTSEDEINKIFGLFEKDATKVIMPLDDTFWNARYGALIDKYGIYWQFNFQK